MRHTPAHWARTPWRRRVVTASPDERQEAHMPPRRGVTRAPLPWRDARRTTTAHATRRTTDNERAAYPPPRTKAAPHAVR